MGNPTFKCWYQTRSSENAQRLDVNLSQGSWTDWVKYLEVTRTHSALEELLAQLYACSDRWCLKRNDKRLMTLSSDSNVS